MAAHDTMLTRRDTLSASARVAGMLAALGLLSGAAARAQGGAYNAAAFSAKTLTDVSRSLGLAAPVESKDVVLTAPDIAENGAAVPLVAATALPGVKSLLILVEKNPAMLAAQFEFSDAVEPQISTQVKMAQSSDVYAVALLNNGRALFARKDVKVTLGGCAA